MNQKKIIAILGATGAQGGGLVKAILKDKNGEFTPRAIVRDPGTDKAKELERQGVEIVQGNIDDADSIQKAFEGAYGAYCVTFYWEHFSPEKEKQQALILVDAAKKASLKHVIWSTLEDTREFIPLSDNRMPTLMDKYKVPHFDAKGESDKHFKESGLPVTLLVASFYWDNMIFFGSGPKKTEDGKYALVLPMGDKKLAGIAAEDIGKCAYGIFKDKDKYVGKTIGIAGEHLTLHEMAEKMSKKMNKEIVYTPVDPETYRGFGFPGADDLGNMFQFYADFEKEGLELRNLETSRELNPELKTFDDWLDKYKNQIPLD